MTDSEKIQSVLGVPVNLIVVGFLIKQAWDGNDKAIILVMFFYTLLILINFVIGWIIRSRVYRAIAIALLVLFLPVLIISSWY
jgi:hypothetical protein